jgi:hypothetical protein
MTADETFENVAEFKYPGMALTDQNCIQEEIHSRLNSGNAYYSAVKNLLSSRLLCEDGKIKICKNITPPLDCEMWSVPLREENMLRVCENVVLKRIFRHIRNVMKGG